MVDRKYIWSSFLIIVQWFLIQHKLGIPFYVLPLQGIKRSNADPFVQDTPSRIYMPYWNPIQWNCCHARVPLDKNQSQQDEKVGNRGLHTTPAIAGQSKIFRHFAWPTQGPARIVQRNMSGINWTLFRALNGRICLDMPLPPSRRTLFNWGTWLRRVTTNQK